MTTSSVPRSQPHDRLPGPPSGPIVRAAYATTTAQSIVQPLEQETSLILMLAQIRELDEGSWFDPGFAGEKVPTVAAVLSLLAECRQHDVLIAVDLKAEDVGQDVVRLADRRRVAIAVHR